MSNKTFKSVICDKCGAEFGGGSVMGLRAVRAEAKADGWKLGKKRDLCKQCTDELDKAVKTLLAAG